MNRIRLIALFLFAAFALYAQDTQEGIASVFDDAFHGKETRYGLKYDRRELTCAHNVHPYQSLLRVTRLDNNRSVMVRVIDEGPFITGRLIEISARAGEMLGMNPTDEAKVRVELVKRAANFNPDEKKEAAETKEESRPSSQPAAYSAPETAVVKTPERTISASTEAVPAFTARNAAGQASAPLVKKDYAKYGLYQVQLRKPALQGWGVQVSSITNAENVLQEVANLQAKSFENILVSIEKNDLGQTLYKFILGPYDTEEKARNYLANLKKRYKMGGFVVNLARGNY